MLIPFNFSIDFLMAYNQNNYEHIAFFSLIKMIRTEKQLQSARTRF